MVFPGSRCRCEMLTRFGALCRGHQGKRRQKVAAMKNEMVGDGCVNLT